MFTGIIQAVGRIARIELQSGDARLRVEAPDLSLGHCRVGDSIAVSGVCLTAVELTDQGFVADVSAETLACTTLGEWREGQRINLELAVQPTSRLGGHLVSGHVDGVGRVVERQRAARSIRFRIQVPDPLVRYIAAKGSVCVDGVSLTVNAVAGADFELNVVPHTLSATTLNEWQSGTRVNVEVDQIARYLERLMVASSDAEPVSARITESFLSAHGFLKK